MTSAASTGRTLFTLAGFRNEMRQVGGNTSGRLFAEQELIPETLDEHPNPALAWVVGLYALVLRRRPEPRRMQDLLTDLRRGAAPADVLEGILRSPDGIGRTVTRPVLEEAYGGAAKKLRNLLESTFGRLDDTKGAASIRDSGLR